MKDDLQTNVETQCADAGPNSPRSPLRDYLVARRDELRAELREVLVAIQALANSTLPQRVRPGSIKEMALRALGDRGAMTSREILEAIEASGRTMPVTSLTPQLSRLKADGLIAYRDRRWVAAPAGTRVAAQVDREESREATLPQCADQATRSPSANVSGEGEP